MMRRAILVLLLLASGAPLASADAIHVCVFRGLGGEPAHEARFQDWSRRLADALVTLHGVAAENVHVYPAPDEDDAGHALTQDGAGHALEALAGQLTPESTLVLVLIGHGSMQREPKFVVAGPDIAAETFRQWLDAVPATRQVVINSTSSSAAFINVLSKPGRIVCTSTRSGMEMNTPEFMEYFVQALEKGRGDADRNGVLSLVELCNAAAADTQQWYASEGYIPTEHALLDDNGDGLGTRLPLEAEAGQESGPDGALAGALTVTARAAHAGASEELVARYEAAIASVKALTASKDTMDVDSYWTKLEALLLDAARLNREIHGPTWGPAGAPGPAVGVADPELPAPGGGSAVP